MSRDIEFRVFSTHHQTKTDGSPLRMISEERLAYFNALEQLVLSMFLSISDLLPKEPDDIPRPPVR